MRRTHLTLLLALSLLLTQARPAALAQSQPAAAPPPAPATAEKPPAPSRVQSPTPLDKHAEKIRRGVRRIGVSQTITVIFADEADLHGTVTNVGDDSFDLAEVDQRRIITIPYAHVKKVRSGYTPPKLFTGERNSPPKGVRIAAFAALIATLALPLIALSRID